MNIHKDFLPFGSWQLQLLGAKTWFLCSPREGAFVGPANDMLDAHNPKMDEVPQFHLARCTNDTVSSFYLSFPWRVKFLAVNVTEVS